jgi:nicotinate-nucleotide--dimethylbenzimidazole phosphoribosyltransferase
MRRPLLGPELDPSRAADRAADPAGWRMDAAARDALAAVIAGRRDVRRFRPEPLDDDVLSRLLSAAHQAPSVGLTQPWRFIVVRSDATRARVRALAERERVRQAPRFGEGRTRAFLDQKVEGILEAPVGVCVCCVPPPPGTEVLGRATIPETDLHSTVCAIENLWLTARAEGVGVGWVSFYRPDDLRDVLGIPAAVDPVAWLCLGWPDERPVRPGLERAGWAARRPLEDVVYAEGWPAAVRGPGAAADAAPAPDAGTPAATPAPDAAARIAARDRADELVKPQGSLGALEDVIERWAAATGAPPPTPLRAAHLVFAADHGHVTRGTSLFDGAVSAQVAAAAARGETALGVLARARGERFVVADVGLVAQTPAGAVEARCAAGGSADFVSGPALTIAQRDAALTTGARLTSDLVDDTGADCLVLGEIGMGNTATAAALLCGLTGADPADVVGRGTGLDAQGVARKVETVRAALARARAATGSPDASASAAGARDPLALLRELGGLELAALVGAIHAAHERRVPVILDGFAVGVCALVAVALRPAAREWLFAGHRSAEPAHALVLRELGLEPLLDLRLRLGEGSGAALALPLIESAGRLHREMATFEQAGVDGPRPTRP